MMLTLLFREYAKITSFVDFVGVSFGNVLDNCSGFVFYEVFRLGLSLFCSVCMLSLVGRNFMKV